MATYTIKYPPMSLPSGWKTDNVHMEKEVSSLMLGTQLPEVEKVFQNFPCRKVTITLEDGKEIIVERRD